MPNPNFIDDFAPPLDMSPGDRFVVQPVGPRTNDYVAPTAAQHWIAGMAGTFDGVNRNTGVTGGVTISATPPTPAIPGMLWWDSVGGQLYVYYNDGNSQQWVIANNSTIDGGGGLFLPLNVKVFGAKGDGVTDDTAAIAATLAAVAAAGGGAVYFPSGVYKVSGNPFVLHSNTRIVGEGREVSVIKPVGLVPLVFAGGTDVPQVFVGHLYSLIGPYAATLSPPGGVYDADIAIEDIGFDFTGESVGACVGSFLFATRISLDKLKLTGPSASCTGVRCITCDRVTMRDITGGTITNMLDCWGGTTRVKIDTIDVVGVDGGGNGGIFNFQGVWSSTITTHSSQYEATNINVRMNGGAVFFLDSGGGGSTVYDVLIENVVVVAASGVNEPIVGRGLGGRVKVHNFVCTALSGASWTTPILIGGFFSYSPIETGTNKITTQAGSNIITVTFSAGTDAGPGNYVSITGASGPLIGNGLTLSGAYKILSVVSQFSSDLNGVVTVDARANATSTGPISATTSIIGYLGSFNDCELNGVTFDGACAATPVVSIAGFGHQINNLNVTTNYGSSPTPQYTILIATDTSSEPAVYVTPRPIQLINIEGDPGVGPIPVGYGGDTFVSWYPYIAVPTIGLVNPVPNGIRFGAQTVSSPTDFSKHIDLYGGVIGLNVQASGELDVVSQGTGVGFFNGTSRVANFSSELGLVISLGGVRINQPGFGLDLGTKLGSGYSDFSNQINLYNGQYGFSVTGDSNLNYVSLGAHVFYGNVQLSNEVGFNGTSPIAKPTVTGSRAAADPVGLSILAALANYGLVTDGTSA